MIFYKNCGKVESNHECVPQFKRLASFDSADQPKGQKKKPKNHGIASRRPRILDTSALCSGTRQKEILANVPNWSAF
jgi:hypothetical protein